MDTDQFSLTPMVTVGGEGMMPQAVDDFAKQWVGGNYLWAFGLIIVLCIVVIWLLVAKFSEKFNPTQTMRMAGLRDGSGEEGSNDPFDYRNEHADDRGNSFFAHEVQNADGTKVLIVDPNAKANQPGSAAWNVLHNPDFNCNGRKSVGDDAWDWMTGVAKEKLDDKPKSDSDFSKVLAGVA